MAARVERTAVRGSVNREDACTVALWPCFRSLPSASRSFFVSRLLRCLCSRLKYHRAQGHMTQGSATTTDICHPPGDGVDSCINARAHAKLTANS